MDAWYIKAGALLAFGFVVGIALSLFYGVGFPFSVFILTVVFGCISLAFILHQVFGDHVRPALWVGFLLLGLALGVLRVELFASTDDSIPEAGTVEVYGTIVSYPEDRDSYRLFTLQTSLIRGETVCKMSEGHISVRADRFSSVSYGDVVVVSGEISVPEPFETDTDRTFRYDRYLAVQGVSRIISFTRVEHAGPNAGNPVLASLFDIKRAYVQALDRLLPEPEASLGAGITAGTRGSLADDFREDLIRTGVIHIVVLSGYNVAILIASVMFAFRFLSQGLRIILAGGIVTLFVLLAGAEPSLVRAALMAFLVLIAAYTNRSSGALRALIVAAVLMLVVQPRILWSPTFILSFLATWGLIAFSPYLEQKLSWIRSYSVRVTLAATTATQIAVLPYLLYAIGEVSLVSLPANIAILISIPFAMLFSFLAGLFGMIVYPIGVVFSWIAFLLLRYETLMIDLFARIPFASVVIPPFPVVLLFLAYAFLGVVWRVVLRAQEPSGV